MNEPILPNNNHLENDLNRNFNVRVYGILINTEQQILVSDEFIRGKYITKFPGGGLEFGEGTKDCLIREYKEETTIDITVGNHIYTTDFYQISAFNPRHQIISIYYFVNADQPFNIKTSTQPFDFAPHQIIDATSCAESFRWIDMNKLEAEMMHLPIDKVVVEILKQDYNKKSHSL